MISAINICSVFQSAPSLCKRGKIPMRCHDIVELVLIRRNLLMWGISSTLKFHHLFQCGFSTLGSLLTPSSLLNGITAALVVIKALPWVHHESSALLNVQLARNVSIQHLLMGSQSLRSRNGNFRPGIEIFFNNSAKSPPPLIPSPPS